jgi:hypothetical protein
VTKISLKEDLLVIIKQVNETCELLDDTAGVPLARSLKGLESAAHGLTLLLEPGGLLSEDLLFPCRTAGNRQAIVAFISQVEMCRNDLARLSASTTDPSSLLDASTAGRLTAVLGLVSKWAIDGHTVAQTRELLGQPLRPLRYFNERGPLSMPCSTRSGVTLNRIFRPRPFCRGLWI